MRRKLFSLLFSVALLVTGCGKESVENSIEVAEKYSYMSEIHTIDESDSYAMGFTYLNNDLYVNQRMYDTETNTTKNCIARYNIDNQNMEKIFPELDDNQNIEQFRMNEDCSFTAIISTKRGTDISAYYITTYNEQGTLMEQVDITEAVLSDTKDGFRIDNLQIDSQGNCYLCYCSDVDYSSSIIKGIMADGGVKFRVEISGAVNGSVLVNENQLFVSSHDLQGSMSIHKIDTTTGDVTKVLEDFSGNEYKTNIFASEEGNKLYFDAASEVYEYDFETGQTNKLFNLIDVGIGSQGMCGLIQHGVDRFYTILNEYDEAKERTVTQLLAITKYDTEENVNVNSEKKVLTVAMLMEDELVEEGIVEFNKKSETHKIELKIYGGTTPEEGINLLQADIAAGRIPDIIDVGGVDAGNYIKKGILADISSFLENDEEVSRDQFVEKALDTYSVEGKLYAMPTQFWLGSLVGKTANLEGRLSWNYEEYRGYVEGLSNTEAATAGASREMMFNRLMEQYAGSYINWNEGSCSFDCEEFIAMLEFANLFPKETEMYNEDRELEMIQSDEILLYPTVMNSVLTFQRNQALFNEPVTYVGFPSESGDGTKMMVLGCAFGITEACEDKDVAWKFIKSLCVDEDIYLSGFPVYKESLEKAFEFAALAYYSTDENGNQIEEVKVEIPYGDDMLKIYAAKPEEIEQLRSLIENADGPDMRNPGIYTILQEEAEEYFNGQKSVQDVVAVIQSRVNIYISENQ